MTTRSKAASTAEEIKDSAIQDLMVDLEKRLQPLRRSNQPRIFRCFRRRQRICQRRAQRNYRPYTRRRRIRSAAKRRTSVVMCSRKYPMRSSSARLQCWRLLPASVSFLAWLDVRPRLCQPLASRKSFSVTFLAVLCAGRCWWRSLACSLLPPSTISQSRERWHWRRNTACCTRV